MSAISIGIAKRLKAARIAAGFKTAKDFATTENIPVTTYSQHESAKRCLTPELIVNYSTKFKINPYWLLTGLGEAFLGQVSHEKKTKLEGQLFPISAAVTNHAKNYKLIDQSLLKQILATAEFLFYDKTVTLSYAELVDYCFELYDTVSSLNLNETEKEKIIKLSVASLKRGTLGISKKIDLVGQTE